MKPNEILGEILLPDATSTLNATYEVREKEALDWPLVTASVALKIKAGKVEHVRLVLGHVAPTPWRCVPAEESLVGKVVDKDSATEAGKSALIGAKPLSKNSYKISLAQVAIKRAILDAALGGT